MSFAYKEGIPISIKKNVDKIIQGFSEKRNVNNAVPMKKYMRNQFEFLGIKTPERRAVARQLIKEIGMISGEELHDFIKALWQLPEREYQYFAVDYMDKYKKYLEPNDIHLLEYMIVHKSWWDTVDLVAGKLVGHLLAKYPHLIGEYAERWVISENMWLRRTAILFQLKYKEKTNQELLFRYILLNAQDKEFFIQKAIGWALREYSKTNEPAVREFISNNKLAPLSVREGMKAIQQKN